MSVDQSRHQGLAAAVDYLTRDPGNGLRTCHYVLDDGALDHYRCVLYGIGAGAGQYRRMPKANQTCLLPKLSARQHSTSLRHEIVVESGSPPPAIFPNCL